jgi:hypothetical protein
MVSVVLLEKRGERESVIGVVSLRTQRVLWATSGPRALALEEAVARCLRRGWAICTECVGAAEIAA